MADFRRVYCTFCQQSFMTASSDQCSLCGKQGGLLDEGSPAALEYFRESKQGSPASSPSPIQASRARKVLVTQESKPRPKVASFRVPPEAVAATEGLGKPLTRFATNPLHVWLYVICGAVLVGLGVLCFASLVRVLSGEAGPVRPFLGCFLLLGGVGLMVRGLGLHGGRLYAFESGLARHVKGELETMRWEDVAIVHRGNVLRQDQFTITTPRRLRLCDRAGREWVFTETLSGFEQFRDLVEEQTRPFLLAAAVEALQSGETLEYGDIRVTPNGLTAPQKPQLGWSSLEQAGIAQGHVVVLAKGMEEPYIAVPLFEMPNAHVFFAILDCYRDGDKSNELLEQGDIQQDGGGANEQ